MTTTWIETTLHKLTNHDLKIICPHPFSQSSSVLWTPSASSSPRQQVEHWNGTIVMTTIDRLLSFNWHLHQMIIFDRLFPLKLQIFVGCADYFCKFISGRQFSCQFPVKLTHYSSAQHITETQIPDGQSITFAQTNFTLFIVFSQLRIRWLITLCKSHKLTDSQGSTWMNIAHFTIFLYQIGTLLL